MKPPILGVDAGGTSTRALVLAVEGKTGSGEAGPANWTTLGPERCAQAIAEAAGGALRSAGLAVDTHVRACVSLAGYYPPWHEAEAHATLRAAMPGALLLLVPDLVAAWAGATGGNAGIVLIAGTGAAAYGRDAAGRAARAGGWGPLFGDEGGGYWIGCEALRAISRALDGRGPRTTLVEGGWLRDEGPEGMGGSRPSTLHLPPSPRIEESLRAVYRDAWSREQVAALCVTVAHHAAAGDAIAAGILECAAAELGALVAAVACRLSWGQRGTSARGPLSVSAVGGVVSAGVPLLSPLERWLAAMLPHARWTAPLGTPLDGALLLAREETLPWRTS